MGGELTLDLDGRPKFERIETDEDIEQDIFALGPVGTALQGYLAHRNTPTSLGPPLYPRHKPMVGS